MNRERYPDEATKDNDVRKIVTGRAIEDASARDELQRPTHAVRPYTSRSGKAVFKY